MRSKMLGGLGVFVLGLGLLVLVVFAGNEQKVSLDEVSPAVRATIEKYAAGAEIKDIELERENGEEIYEVEVLRNGKEEEFKVAKDGKFLGYEEEEDEEEEEEVSYESLPGTVKAAVEKYLGVKGKFEVEEEEENGVMLYEIEVEEGELEQEVKVTENGEVVEVEQEIAISQLPLAVVSTIKKEYPNAIIKEAESIQLFYYEVELLMNGKEKEIYILPYGKIKCQVEEEENSDEHEKDDD